MSASSSVETGTQECPPTGARRCDRSVPARCAAMASQASSRPGCLLALPWATILLTSPLVCRSWSYYSFSSSEASFSPAMGMQSGNAVERGTEHSLPILDALH